MPNTDRKPCPFCAYTESRIERVVVGGACGPNDLGEAKLNFQSRIPQKQKEPKMNGSAPCYKCEWFNESVGLTGYSEPANDGGKNWECRAGQFCPSCNEPLRWLHQPAPESLIIILIRVN